MKGWKREGERGGTCKGKREDKADTMTNKKGDKRKQKGDQRETEGRQKETEGRGHS